MTKIKSIKKEQTDHTVHVGFGPDYVVVVVDNHRPAENMEIFHNIFLDISQCGHVCVIACRTNRNTHLRMDKVKECLELTQLFKIGNFKTLIKAKTA